MLEENKRTKFESNVLFNVSEWTTLLSFKFKHEFNKGSDYKDLFRGQSQWMYWRQIIILRMTTYEESWLFYHKDREAAKSPSELPGKTSTAPQFRLCSSSDFGLDSTGTLQLLNMSLQKKQQHFSEGCLFVRICNTIWKIIDPHLVYLPHPREWSRPPEPCDSETEEYAPHPRSTINPLDRQLLVLLWFETVIKGHSTRQCRPFIVMK